MNYFRYLAFPFFLLFFLHSSINGKEIVIPKAFQIDLNDSGMKALSRMLEEDFGQQQDILIPDYQFSIPLIAHVSVNNVKLSYKLSSLNLLPFEDGIFMNARISDFRVNVNDFVVKNYFIPAAQASCVQTQVAFSEPHDSSFDLDLRIQHKAEGLDIKVEKVKWNLPSHTLRTNGPESCYGPFGGRSVLLKLFYQNLGKWVIPSMENALRNQSHLISSVVQSKINNSLQSDFYLPFPAVGPFDSQLIKVNLFANRFKVNQDGVKAEFGLKLAKASANQSLNITEDQLISPIQTKDQVANNKSILFPSEARAISFGELSINPDLISGVIKSYLPSANGHFYLTKDLHELAKMFLDQENLALYWPDLENQSLPEQYFQLKLLIASLIGPSMNWEDQSLEFGINNLSMMFQAPRTSDSNIAYWEDYYHLSANINAGVEITSRGPYVGLKASKASIQIEGNWASNYTPRNPLFHQTDFHYFAQGLLDAMIEHGQEIYFFPIKIGRSWFGPKQPHYEDPYIRFELLLYK